MDNSFIFLIFFSNFSGISRVRTHFPSEFNRTFAEKFIICAIPCFIAFHTTVTSYVLLSTNYSSSLGTSAPPMRYLWLLWSMTHVWVSRTFWWHSDIYIPPRWKIYAANIGHGQRGHRRREMAQDSAPSTTAFRTSACHCHPWSLRSLCSPDSSKQLSGIFIHSSYSAKFTSGKWCTQYGWMILLLCSKSWRHHRYAV